MLTGTPLLHEVGKRILGRYLEIGGAAEVAVSPAMRVDATGVDIRWSSAGERQTAKVKIDCYCGTDAEKIADRDFAFYRRDTASYALEAIADTSTRALGWVQASMADELHYYRVCIARPEAEIAALLESPDGVFFSELAVERDDLRIIPMRELREWFVASNDRYTPRPVFASGRSAWYRIVPMAELEAEVRGVKVVGPIYKTTGAR